MAAMHKSFHGGKPTALEKQETTGEWTPESPDPDYELDGHGRVKKRNSCKFVKNFQNVIFNIRSIEELYTCFPEPAPDYDASESDDSNNFPPPPPPLTAEQLSEAVMHAYEQHSSNPDSPTETEPNTLKAKPLANPCAESKERQMLHKELLMNYKIGKDVLQKPELSKVLNKRRETQRKKEWEEHNKVAQDPNSLEVKLQQRANKLKEEEEKSKSEAQHGQTPEFLKMHRRITHKANNTDNS